MNKQMSLYNIRKSKSGYKRHNICQDTNSQFKQNKSKMAQAQMSQNICSGVHTNDMDDMLTKQYTNKCHKTAWKNPILDKICIFMSTKLGKQIY